MTLPRLLWLPAVAAPLLALVACGPAQGTGTNTEQGVAPAAMVAATDAPVTPGATAAGAVATGDLPAPEPTIAGPAAGTYAAALPAADAGARLLTLTLVEDGTATLTTGYVGKGTVVEAGKWSQDGDTVTVTLTETDGVPAPEPTTFEFLVEAGNLVNKVWSQELYGETGLGTLLKQP